MWFDTELVKNISSQMIAPHEMPTLDEIVELRLGSLNTVSNPILFQSPISGLSHAWHEIILSGYIMSTMFLENRKTSAISNDYFGFHITARNLSSVSKTMDIFDFIERKSDQEFLRCISQLEYLNLKRTEQLTGVQSSSAGNEDFISFEPLQCIKYGFEEPTLPKTHMKADSLSSLKQRVFSLTGTTWEGCFFSEEFYFIDNIKNYCTKHLMIRERWHEGPRDMMAKCNELHDPRRFDLISLCEQQFTDVVYSPCSEDIVESSLDIVFHKSCRRGSRDILDNERMAVWQLSRNEIQAFQFSDRKQFVEHDYDSPKRIGTSPLELKIFARGISSANERFSKNEVDLIPRDGFGKQEVTPRIWRRP